MTTGFIIGAGGGAVELTQNTDLLRAGDKKVQFMCSQEAPVKVKFVDGTEQELTSIGDLELQSYWAGGLGITSDKLGVSRPFYWHGLNIATDGWASGFDGESNCGWIKTDTYPTTKENIFPITFGFKTSELPTSGDYTIICTPKKYIWAVNISTDGKLALYLGSQNNTTFDIANGTKSTNTISLDTHYKVTINYDGTNYTLSVRNMDVEGSTDEAWITVASTTLIAGTSPIRVGFWGASSSSFSNFFKGSFYIPELKVGNFIDESNFTNLAYPILGTITLNSDKAIKSISSNYAVQTENQLEQVNIHTTDSYSRAIENTEISDTQMDVVEDIGDNYNPLYFANVKIISVNTSYTFTQNGTFFAGSASIATITITKNGSSFTLYSTTARIPRGCSFTTSVAGKFCFDDNYYGYLAN